MRFKDFIEMAIPRSSDYEKVYYHGTSSLLAAKNIIVNGIDPAATEIKYGAKKPNLRPVAGRVYITPDLRTAIVYALGGDILGHDNSIKDTEQYGVVLKIPGSQLQDIQPDEDDVGSILHIVMSDSIEKSKQFYTQYNWNIILSIANSLKYLAQQHLTPIQANEMAKKWGKAGDTHYQAMIGKKMNKVMSDNIKHALIDAGAHIAHQGKLLPSEAWMIDKNKSKELTKDGSNFFSVAQKIK